MEMRFTKCILKDRWFKYVSAIIGLCIPIILVLIQKNIDLNKVFPYYCFLNSSEEIKVVAQVMTILFWAFICAVFVFAVVLIFVVFIDILHNVFCLLPKKQREKDVNQPLVLDYELISETLDDKIIKINLRINNRNRHIDIVSSYVRCENFHFFGYGNFKSLVWMDRKSDENGISHIDHNDEGIIFLATVDKKLKTFTMRTIQRKEISYLFTELPTQIRFLVGGETGIRKKQKLIFNQEIELETENNNGRLNLYLHNINRNAAPEKSPISIHY